MPHITTLHNAAGHSPPIMTQIYAVFFGCLRSNQYNKGRLNAQSTLYFGEPCTSPPQILQAVIPFFRTAILRITVYPSSGTCNRFPIHVIPSLCQSYASLSTVSGVPAAHPPSFIRNPLFFSCFFLSAAEPHCVVFLYKNRKTLQLSSFTAVSSCENKNRPRNTVTYIYSLSMGTAILITKTFLTSEYKLNSRIRHY